MSDAGSDQEPGSPLRKKSFLEKVGPTFSSAVETKPIAFWKICLHWSLPSIIVGWLATNGANGFSTCYPNRKTLEQIDLALSEGRNISWGDPDFRCTIAPNPKDKTPFATPITTLHFKPQGHMRDFVLIYTNLSAAEPLPLLHQNLSRKKDHYVLPAGLERTGGVSFKVQRLTPHKDERAPNGFKFLTKVVAAATTHILDVRTGMGPDFESLAPAEFEQHVRAFPPSHVAFDLTGNPWYRVDMDITKGQQLPPGRRVFYSANHGHYGFLFIEGLQRLALAIMLGVVLRKFIARMRELALAIFGINDPFYFLRVDYHGSWFSPPLLLQRSFFSMLYLFMLLAISSIHSGNETFQLRNCRGKVVLVLLERFLKMGARLEGDYEDEGEVMIFLDVICILVMVGWFILALFLAAFRLRKFISCPRTLNHPADILLASNLILIPAAWFALLVTVQNLTRRWSRAAALFNVDARDPMHQYSGFMSDLRQKFTMPYLVLINQYLLMLAYAYWPTSLIKAGKHGSADGSFLAATPSILLTPLDKV